MDKFELGKILSEDRKKHQDKLDKINDEILNSIENSNTRIEKKFENIINDLNNKTEIMCDKIDSNNKWIMSVCITIILATIILIIKLNS
ncbi:hypothetical protein LFJ64_002677 [Clostridium perfringens]|uniref:hypothetical protein n=1 Tax=Clostridium perfringens TaxID=1502 RepID=UPI0024BD14FA|nr:hypothetical protein [Clostridium perfringens]EIF6165895.1 hypothetical protein [Clostridium perfringens]